MANPYVEKVAKDHDTNLLHAYELIRENPSLVPEGVIKQYIPRNQKAAIKTALVDGPSDLETLHNVLKKDRDLGLDMHNLIHVLHSMKKQGIINFTSTSGGQNGQSMKNIALRPAELKKMGVTPRKARPVSPVGKDMTDPRQHKTVAEGGEIERIKAAGQKAIEEASAITIEYEQPPVYRREVVARPVEQNEKLVPPMPAVVADRVPLKSIRDVVEELGSYPLIRELSVRRSKVESASKLLEEAGQPDLALMALEKIEYTPFEKEVLRLWESLS